MTWLHSSAMIETVRVRIVAGTPIGEACQDAARLAHRLRAKVEFEFNGLELSTRGDATEPLNEWRQRFPFRHD